MSSLPERSRFAQISGAVFFLLGALVYGDGRNLLAVDLEWADEAGYRSAAVKPATGGRVGFVRLEPQRTGIDFTNIVPFERHSVNQILLNGSGVAAGDVDGDGDLDLVVNSVGQGTLCFWNDGHGHFAPTPLVLNQGRCGSSLALADIDGDGLLDLYIANYRTSTIRDQPGAGFTIKTVNGAPQPVAFGGRALTEPGLTNRFAFRYKPGSGGGGSVFHDELGEPDVLYHNEGGGRFVPVPFADGAFLNEEGKPLSEAPLDWGLSVMMRDFNGDGAPDIYVCNDFATPDRFWMNDGKGRFRAASSFAIRQTSL